MRALRLVCEFVSIGLLISFAFPGECVRVCDCLCVKEKNVLLHGSFINTMRTRWAVAINLASGGPEANKIPVFNVMFQKIFSLKVVSI